MLENIFEHLKPTNGLPHLHDCFTMSATSDIRSWSPLTKFWVRACLIDLVVKMSINWWNDHIWLWWLSTWVIPFLFSACRAKADRWFSEMNISHCAILSFRETKPMINFVSRNASIWEFFAYNSPGSSPHQIWLKSMDISCPEIMVSHRLNVLGTKTLHNFWTSCLT